MKRVCRGGGGALKVATALHAEGRGSLKPVEESAIDSDETWKPKQ